MKKNYCTGTFLKPKIPNRKVTSPEEWKNKKKVHKCFICGFINFDAWSLTLHIRRHQKERSIRCPVCPKTFVTRNEFNTHNNECHIKLKRIKCQFCPEKFITKRMKYMHEDKHGILKHQCKFCDETFANRFKRGLHHKTHISGALTCTVCTKSFSSKKFLDKHYSVRHSNDYKCKMCKTVFNLPEDTVEHQNLSGHSGVIRKAVYSNVPTKKPKVNPYSSKDRIDHKYIDPKLLSKCQELMKYDESVKLDCYVHQCKLCLKEFALIIDLKAHIDTIHPEEKAKVLKYPCTKCDKMFETKPQLTGHMVSHGPKKHQCPECNYRTVRKCDLGYHIRKHTKAPLYNCKVCSKTYVSKHSFEEHKISHTELKFQCDVCQSMYGSKHSLTVHKKKVHYVSKMVCEQCGGVFANPTSLQSHMRRIHREVSSSCLCTKCSSALLVKDIGEHLTLCHRSSAGGTTFSIDGPTCGECSIVFSNKSILKCHYKLFHPHLIFCCKKPFCPWFFFCEDKLQLHLYRHDSKSKRDPTRTVKPHKRVLSIEEKREVKLDRKLDCELMSYECFACGLVFNDHSNWKAHASSCFNFLDDLVISNRKSEYSVIVQKNIPNNQLCDSTWSIRNKDRKPLSKRSRRNLTKHTPITTELQVKSADTIKSEISYPAEVVKIEICGSASNTPAPEMPSDSVDDILQRVAVPCSTNDIKDGLPKVDQSIFSNHLLEMLQNDTVNIGGSSFLQFDHLISRLKEYSNKHNNE